jgi:DNA polymerase III subunit beta
MKSIVNVKSVEKALRIMSKGKNSPIPMFDNITSQDGVITMHSNNGEIRLQLPVDFGVPFTIEKSSMLDIISVFGDNINASMVSVDKVQFAHGKESVKLAVLSDEVPMLKVPTDATRSLTITGDDIASMKIASQFVGSDNLRPVLMDVWVHSNCIVATDSHRLFWRNTTNATTDQFNIKEPVIQLLDLFHEPWTVYLTDTTVYFINDQGIIISQKKSDERYPNWLAVIPEKNPTTLKMTKCELVSAIKKGSKFASQSTRQVCFNMEKKTLSFKDIEYGKEYVAEALSMQVDGDPFEISFNYNLLMELIKHMGEVLTFNLSAPNRAAVVNSECLIMPVMLSNY